MTTKTPDSEPTLSVPIDSKLIEDSLKTPEPREPVVWADNVSPFTGPQVLELLKENEKLREEVVPGSRHVALQKQYVALRALYDEQALKMAGRIAEISNLNAELSAHQAALVKQGKTSVFGELMKVAQTGGAKHLAFAVTLDDYFPYPSPKDSWVCEAFATNSPTAEPIAGGKGRSGEEALRLCVSELTMDPVKK